MSVENNKKIVRSFIEQVWNKAEYALVSQFIADDYVAYGLGSKTIIKGVNEVLVNAQTVHQNFPQFRITIEDMFGEGDKVVSRLILHTLKDTKEITKREIIIHRIEGDKIREAWAIGSSWD